MGTPGVVMASGLRARESPKIDAQTSTPISCPQSFELAISRTKRGGVEFIIASFIPQVSMV